LRYRRVALVDRRRVGRSPRFVPPTSAEEWSAELAYAVGLIATDGCLSSDRKTVAQVSKDLDLLETFKRCIGTAAPIRPHGTALRVQISDVGLYRWLETIGLTPKKSLTLGPLAVPDDLIAHVVRGLLDGDGSIYTGLTTPNRSRYPLHSYQRLLVKFHSASPVHIEWLRQTINRVLGLEGWVTAKRKRDASRNYAPVYMLRYSKHESMVLLPWLYQDANGALLERKRRKWIEFRDHGKSTRNYRRRKPRT
jgi:predicted GIY-YIG superfamily endonuclease